MLFTKAQAAGNDFIVLDAFLDPSVLTHHDPHALATSLCDRHFGIGADGLLIVGPSDDSVPTMIVFNADGSDGQACGNGLRCVAKLLVERRHAAPDEHARVAVRTSGRLALANVHLDDSGGVEAITVDMGAVSFDHAAIPLDGAHAAAIDDHTVRIDNAAVLPVAVTNPHAIVLSDKPQHDLFTLGPTLERHPAFPSGANVHLVSIASTSEASALTWERGVGHTLACGSGACAVVAALHRAGRLDATATVRSPGGELVVRYDPADHRVFLTGDATIVFTGEIDP